MQNFFSKFKCVDVTCQLFQFHWVKANHRNINAEILIPAPTTISQRFLPISARNMDLSKKTESPTIGLARTYICGDCNQVTRNPRLYLQHRRDFHRDPITIHECDLCVYASKHSQKLMRHRRTVHRNQIEANEMSATVTAKPDVLALADAPLNLSKSPKATPNDPHPTNIRYSSCKWCPLQAFNKATLIDHIRQKHPFVEILKCSECNYSHFDRDKFNRHQRYHTLNYIKCTICDFQTIYKWNLERHMKHHIDGLPMNATTAFKCSKCNFTASTKQSITAHELGHHSIQSKATETKEMPVDDSVLDDGEIVMAAKKPIPKPFDVTEFLELVWSDIGKRDMEERTDVGNDDCDDGGGKDDEIDPMKYFVCCNCNYR